MEPKGDITSEKISVVDILQTAILPGRDTVLLLKCPVEGGVIAKACHFSDLSKGKALRHQILCHRQPLLGNIAMKADSEPVPAQVCDGTLTDQKLPGRAADGYLLLQMTFDIFQQFIQQFI